MLEKHTAAARFLDSQPWSYDWWAAVASDGLADTDLACLTALCKETGEDLDEAKALVLDLARRARQKREAVLRAFQEGGGATFIHMSEREQRDGE